MRPAWPVALVVLLACAHNPATGKRIFNLLGTDQEIALGVQATPQFLASYGGEVPDAELVAYVRRIGHALAAKSERPDLPWEFHVVDSGVVNAFALPGGKVFVTRGLLEKLDNEAQLAGVLGHEIGHVTAEHIGQQMSRAMAIQVAATAVGVYGQYQDQDWLRALGVGAQVGGSLYLLKFGRDQELQADSLGMRYMTRDEYNPAAQVQVLDILRGLEGGAAQPAILSTHPEPKARVERANKILRKDYAGTENLPFYADRYQARALRELAALPPPRHAPRGEASAPAYRQQVPTVEQPGEEP